MRPDRAASFHWRRSRRCQSTNGCVEVAEITGPDGPFVAVRDGSAPDSTVHLLLGPAAWKAFLTALRTPEPHDRRSR